MTDKSKEAMRALVITMPERRERVSKLIHQLNSVNIEANILPAVDARNPSTLASLVHSLDVLTRFSLGQPRLLHATIATPGALGCYASHVKAWNQVAKSSDPMFIMEDDMEFSSHVDLNVIHKCYEFVSNDLFDMIHMGHSSDLFDSKQPTIVRVITPMTGMLMYCLSPKGARHLLAKLSKPCAHVDMAVGMLAHTTALDEQDQFRLGLCTQNLARIRKNDSIIGHDESTTKYLGPRDYLQLYKEYYANPWRIDMFQHQSGQPPTPNMMALSPLPNGQVQFSSRDNRLGTMSRRAYWYNSLTCIIIVGVVFILLLIATIVLAVSYARQCRRRVE